MRPPGWLAILRLFAAALLACSSWAAAQDEVPFITTPDNVTVAMLELAGVAAGDRVIDLGSGDGRIVITAARRFGARGLGVEIVPELVAQSRVNAQKAGVADRAEFREQDLFTTDLRGASVITMYLLPEVNLQLRPRLLALEPGTRIVSHDWDLGDWAPDRSISVDAPAKTIGRDKRSTLHLWRVPAQVQGLWCTAGATLEITQRFQRFSATLSAQGAAAPSMVFDGRIEGRTLLATGTTGERRAELRLEDGLLRMHHLTPPGLAFEQRVFQPAPGDNCP
jgi:SAM-dependent methyltransferase